VTAIAEIPILTPRTLDLLDKAIPAEDREVLRDHLQSLKPIFAAFLRSDDRNPDEAFILASCKYVYPRLHLILLLLRVFKPAQLLQLVAITSEAASEMLSRHGWRLGADVEHLKKAWNTYSEIGNVLSQNFAKLIQLTTLPYGCLMASTAMDFSLTGTALYLEGELPDADASRLRYACRAADFEATKVRDFLADALFPASKAVAKSQRLARLFGSWADDGRLDEDLESLYKSRLYSSPDLS
jgi:hypothetical protein